MLELVVVEYVDELYKFYKLEEDNYRVGDYLDIDQVWVEWASMLSSFRSLVLYVCGRSVVRNHFVHIARTHFGGCNDS
ncbi:hypothetical protein RchiOBHm_Chr1g0353501 [Rosa chinensis]|uniref:Uncharacterized protein n=1 Tax=Rosa chinensis TaxID=74649 RepID=A0A2P6SGW6_ROSCH|nr:hypothetical protein RchiOBHm_Chr1g0353501 [Rosa chinensis]